jgi:hypothetical protein
MIITFGSPLKDHWALLARKGALPDEIGFVLKFAVGMRFPTLSVA